MATNSAPAARRRPERSPAASLAASLTASLTALLATSILFAAPSPVWSRETAPPAACQAAATSRPIVAATAALENDPDDPRASVALADAWSDAGCFNAAVEVLQRAAAAHPGNQELETRLRVARSLVGEEHFFDNLDRATAEARLKRDSFRCVSLADLESCNDALRLKPDDPALLVEQGDALLRARRPADAVNRYRLAAVLAPDQHDVTAKIAAAESQLGPPAVGAADPTATAAPPGTTSPTAAFAAPARSPAASALAASASAASPGSARRTPQEGSDTGPLRAAIGSGAAGPARRYSNAEPETQSH